MTKGQDVDMTGEDGGLSAAAQLLASVEADLGGVPVNFNAFKPHAVFAGEAVTESVSLFGKQLRLGAGLVQSGENVHTSSAGILRFKAPNRYWVEVDGPHRYHPRADEMVIGTVIDRGSESYRIDIGSVTTAELPLFAFHGATKRNHPDMEIGALVYCRVAACNKFIEPELTCISKTGPHKDWTTGQALFGELQGGATFRCSQSYCVRLLHPTCYVLEALGSALPFELAVGLNGRVWVNAAKPSHVVLVGNVICQAESMTPEEVTQRVRALVKAL